MKSILTLFIVTISLAAYSQVKIEIDTISKSTAENYLLSKKTGNCAFTYYFTKADLAVSRANCAANIAQRIQDKEIVFCELLQINLRNGEIDNFNPPIIRASIGYRRVRGRCSAENLDNLMSTDVIQDVQYWNLRGFSSTILKDSFGFKTRFESKVTDYIAKEKKDSASKSPNKKSKN